MALADQKSNPVSYFLTKPLWENYSPLAGGYHYLVIFNNRSLKTRLVRALGGPTSQTHQPLLPQCLTNALIPGRGPEQGKRSGLGYVLCTQRETLQMQTQNSNE